MRNSSTGSASSATMTTQKRAIGAARNPDSAIHIRSARPRNGAVSGAAAAVSTAISHPLAARYDLMFVSNQLLTSLSLGPQK